ncbi:MAG: hypothetical protein MK111_18505 [Crocosphaera sp.]|uniref:hypothetical protein n=1 Tax=Crocosphaera watsonii TaxID=263511 RepID=UPI0005679DCE|nr:hypothetical protein [Crocosphaera watsonii]MCH2246592.1 hypothetical protein [Crocosphaera sp.]
MVVVNSKENMKAYIVMRGEYPFEAFLSKEEASKLCEKLGISIINVLDVHLQTNIRIKRISVDWLQPSQPDTTGYFPDGTSSGVLPSCPIRFQKPVAV